MTEHAFSFDLERGKPKPFLRPWLMSVFAGLKDGRYRLVITEDAPKVSDPQRAWYFGQIVRLCAKETGHSKDYMHEILKARHLPKDMAEREENGVLVGELVIGGSITKLTRAQFTEYCDEIREWALVFLRVRIKDPDPNWRNLPDNMEEAA